MQKNGKSSNWPVDYQEQFWTAYPRKIGKKAALSLLDKIKKRAEVEWDFLLRAVNSYAALNLDPRFICHPTTWLNQGRWDDQVEHVSPQPKRSPWDGMHGGGFC